MKFATGIAIKAVVLALTPVVEAFTVPLPSIPELPSIGFVASPPTDSVGAALTTLQVLIALGRPVGEIQEPLKYSKFSDKDILRQPTAIDARTGFFIDYGPAFAIALGYYFTSPGQDSLVPSLLALHFGKRLLECAFLHDYSGSKATSLDVPLKISSYYSLITLLIGANALPTSETVASIHTAGLALFAIGQAGNFYHHYLLQQLRSQREPDQDYLPPQGGLFGLVATPHYLFEIMSWTGIALVAQQFNAFIEIPSVLGYFAVRAWRTNELYKESFSAEQWPASRKNLLPFLF